MSHEAAPLSSAELAEFDQFLLAAEEAACAPIDEIHGFITALLVGPAVPDRDACLRTVWGEAEFADEAQRERMHGYLQRMQDEIAEVLAARRPFEPLIIEEEDEDGELLESYEGWCLGFMHGVAEQHERWEAMPKGEQELLSPIARLALLCADEEAEMDEEEYAMCVELLPGAVAGLYTYWRGQPT